MSDDLVSDSTAEGSQDNRRLVKSKVPNLFVMLPGGVYYGRVEVNGRRLKKSLETTGFEVAKRRLKRWLDEVQDTPSADSMLGSLAEAYAKRLQLKVKTGDIKPRTRDMKLESLGQCNKVWQNCSPPGGLTLRFTAKEGTTRRRRPYEQSF